MLSLILIGALTHAAPTTWPAVDAQRVGPAVDSPWTSVTSSPALPPSAAVAVQMSYLNQPLTWTPPDGSAAADVVGGLVRLDLQASHGWGPLRLALSAPLTVRTHSTLLAAPTGTAGDPAVDLKWRLWGTAPDHPTHAGIAVHGGIRVPAGASAEQMGLAGPGGRLGLLGEVAQPDGWGLLFDGAYRIEPQLQLGAVNADDAIDLRTALLLPTTIGLHPSIEAVFLVPVPNFSEPALFNRELIANLGREISNQAVIRAHGGVGIGAAVGTPAWRLGLSLCLGLTDE